MVNRIELGSVLGDFFGVGAGLFHDRLHEAFHRTGLAAVIPRRAGEPARVRGMTKRVRGALAHATDTDPPAGLELARPSVP